MLTDFMSLDNYGHYNIALAHMIGLEPAVYVSELINIRRKAVRKQKFRYINPDLFDTEKSELYFIVDRKYIEEVTTLSVKKQVDFDNALIDLKIIKKTDNPDEIFFDEEYFVNLFADQNETVIKKITPTMVKKGTKTSKAEYTKEQTKCALKTDDEELYNAYRDWVDAVYANPKAGVFTVAAAKLFKKTVETFTNGNRNALMEILQFATISGFKTPEWVINDYKKKHNIPMSCNLLPTQTVQATTNTTNPNLVDFGF